MTIASLGNRDRSVEILSLRYGVLVVEGADSYVELAVPAIGRVDVARRRRKRIARLLVTRAPLFLRVTDVVDWHPSFGRQGDVVTVGAVRQLEKVFSGGPLINVGDPWQVHRRRLPILILKVEGFLTRRFVEILAVE